MRTLTHKLALTSVASAVRGGSSGTPAPSITAKFSTGVAPFGVVFSALGTTGVADPWRDLTYFWDFGDVTAGNYSYGPMAGTSANREQGRPVACHVYETPGVYYVRVWAWDGSNFYGSAAYTVTVTDPDVVFPPNRTWYVSSSGVPVPGVGGVPANALPANCVQYSDFKAAYNAVMAPAEEGKRMLLRAGDTFTSSSGQTGSTTTPPSNVYFGRYGAGANPVIDTRFSNGSVYGIYTNLSTWNKGPQGIRFVGIDVTCPAPALVTASQSTNIVTVTAVSSGTIMPGMVLFSGGAGGQLGQVQPYGSGGTTGTGGVGTYQMSDSRTVASASHVVRFASSYAFNAGAQPSAAGMDDFINGDYNLHKVNVTNVGGLTSSMTGAGVVISKCTSANLQNGYKQDGSCAVFSAANTFFGMIDNDLSAGGGGEHTVRMQGSTYAIAAHNRFRWCSAQKHYFTLRGMGAGVLNLSPIPTRFVSVYSNEFGEPNDTATGIDWLCTVAPQNDTNGEWLEDVSFDFNLLHMPNIQAGDAVIITAIRSDFVGNVIRAYSAKTGTWRGFSITTAVFNSSLVPFSGASGALVAGQTLVQGGVTATVHQTATAPSGSVWVKGAQAFNFTAGAATCGGVSLTITGTPTVVSNRGSFPTTDTRIIGNTVYSEGTGQVIPVTIGNNTAMGTTTQNTQIQDNIYYTPNAPTSVALTDLGAGTTTTNTTSTAQMTALNPQFAGPLTSFAGYKLNPASAYVGTVSAARKRPLLDALNFQLGALPRDAGALNNTGKQVAGWTGVPVPGEGVEFFYLNLSSPSGLAIAKAQGVGTINP